PYASELPLDRLRRTAAAELIRQIGGDLSNAMVREIRDQSDGVPLFIEELTRAVVAGGLEQLVTAGLVFPEGSGPYRSYRFKHALVQSTAYESLLRSARQQLHARVAAVLEDRFPATLPEQVAEHWVQAGEPSRATAFWQSAGEQSIRSGANREAIALLTKGLDALTRAPDSTERDRSEIALQLALAEALIADRGWTAAETQPCWTRARELCERTG